MKKKSALIAVIVFVGVLALAGIALAQEGLTLEKVAGQVAELISDQEEMRNRLSALETRVAPTETPTVTQTPVETVATTPEPTATPTRAPTRAPTPTPIASTDYPRYQVVQIFDDFEANDARATSKYVEKMIEVTGIIWDIEKKGGGIFSGPERYEVTLDGEGFLRFLDCDFPLASEEEVFVLSAGETVTLRGYVEFGNSVKIRMENCVVVE